MTNNTQHNEILSMVAHDLKSPLTVILGELDLLSLDDLSKPEQKQSIKSIRKVSKSMITLIESIIVMSKLEVGKASIELEEMQELEFYFKDIVSTFRFEIKQKNINLNLKIPDNLPTVNWDINKLHYHVLNNLLSNAIKFTNPNGNILFKIEKKEPYIHLCIKDDGIGIEKHKIKTIFNKFETHNNQKIYKGHGLGLYNAYNFVTQHNGTIKAVKGLNKKGIGFLIKLPIEPNNEKLFLKKN